VEEVLMIGTSPKTKGGIASVVNAYMAGGLFERVPITYLTSHRDGSFATKLSTLFGAVLSYVWWLLWKRRFLLHVHTSSRNSFWRKCLFLVPALLLRKPVILHLHGSEFMAFFEKECGRTRQSVVRWVFSRCTKVIVLSESWRRNVAQISRRENLQVLKNPSIEFGKSSFHEGPKSPMLLFLGRLGRRKGIYVLLNAMVEVHSRFPLVTLNCGGDGEIEEVKAQVDQLGLSGVVKVLGWVSGAEKKLLLESASIFVLPSYDEGAPMSILEAMSAGLAIVATPVGGIPEIVREGLDGFLIPTGDSLALADAVCRLLADPEMVEAMGKNSLERFRAEHGVERVLGALEGIYREVGLVLPGAGSS